MLKTNRKQILIPLLNNPNPDCMSDVLIEEKIVNVFFMFSGIASIACALIFLYIIKYSFFKGMAIPILFIGILELTAITYSSSFSNCRLIYQIGSVIVLLTGLFLFIRFYFSPQVFWKGLGLGIIVQTVLFIVLFYLKTHPTIQSTHPGNDFVTKP